VHGLTKSNNLSMSAIGTKRMSLVAPHMSAFGGKADMTKRKYPLLQSQLGEKRTCLVARQMSAYDPKRTLADHAAAPFQAVRHALRIIRRVCTIFVKWPPQVIDLIRIRQAS
jgi:hypothetical protein